MATMVREKHRARRPAPLEGSPTDAQEVPGWTGRLMVWMRFGAQAIGIQLLMLAGVVVGLVVLGVGPALAAGGQLLARLVAGDASPTLWRDFWAGYRANARRATLVVLPALLVVALAWYELLVLQAHGEGIVVAWLMGAVVVVALYALCYLSYAPAVLRRYTDGPARTVRFLAVAPLVSPLTAVGCMVTSVAVLIVGLRFLPLLLLAGLSVPVMLTGILVDRFLDRVDHRDGDPVDDTDE